MKRALLAVGFLGLVMAGSSATASMIGQCNARLGKFLGAENQVVNGIDVAGRRITPSSRGSRPPARSGRRCSTSGHTMPH